MAEGLPLTSLLAQVLIALTIEADNEAERRIPHFISDSKGPWVGVWLISHAMHANFLRFVGDDGIRMADLAAAAGHGPPVHPAYHGMRRWGYVTYTPDVAGASPKVKDAEAIVRCTPNGKGARDTWEAVLTDMQARWSERGLDPLQAALIPIAEAIDRPLPEYFPNVSWDRRVPELDRPVSRPPLELALLALLSQCLVAMTYDFEARSPLSLGTCAALLRPLSTEPVLVRDLYELSGVAKKEWASAVGQLQKLGLVDVGPIPAGKTKSIRLAADGVVAKERARVLLEGVETEWRKRCGPLFDTLRKELERVVDDAWSWTEPYPDGWRATVKLPRNLAHHPIVSHRGGYPDGS